ncbi:MAG: hypothetical protein OEW85_06520, partial [Acidimicrobiia bacterium]|nr:hypothetical protein [Acidimicrobiia bacterium]
MPTPARTARVHRFGALVTVIVVVSGLTVAAATPVHGGPRSAGRAPDVLIGDEVAPVAADLGEVAESAATTVAEVPEAEAGDVGAGAPVFASPDRDPLVQADALPAGAGLADTPGELSAPQQSFAGMTVPVSPPDTVGDVGPDHYVQMVNATSLQIWDKAGTSLVGPLSFASIWPAGDPCASNLGDPIVIYDQIADRWLLTQFARTSPAGPHFMCLALSQTADPTNGYWLYTFAVPAFPDYPKFGVWHDGYYMTSFEGTDLGVYVFDRVDMLVGAPANFLRTTIPALSPQAGVRSTRILPADVDGPVPPAGTGVPFVRTVDDTQDTADPTERIEIYEATVDFGAASLLFPLVDTLSPASFRVMSCDRNGEGVRDCIPQPDSDDTIDALSNRPMMSLKYRSAAGGARMVFNQTVDVGAGLTGLPFAPTGEVAGIRWYQLHGGAGWSIGDQGTYAPQPAGITSEDQLIHRWMGSAAIDAAGNIAMAYSAVNSDSTDGNEIYPSLWYTGRQAGDAAGQMTQPEQTILAGTTPQGDDAAPVTPQRWGDYAAMSVDPVDECTFWFTGHNAGNPSRPTRIASFSFATCSLTGATCNGLPVTVDLNVGQVPTAGADVILGTPGADVIVALGGDDTICAQGGADTVNAGPGADWVDAGAGDDIVFGQDGDDTIGGGLGADQLLGFANNDTI